MNIAQTSIDAFKARVAARHHRPKFAVVNPDLWSTLDKAGLIKRHPGWLNGVIQYDAELPYFDNDILLFCDASLLIRSVEFDLPPDKPA